MGAVELLLSFIVKILICDQKGHQDFTLECFFSVCFQFVHGREKRTSAKKLPHFLGELSHCHFVTNYFDFWGREVSAYFSCPPLFEQNILFYDISFLFLTQMTPKTALG